MILICDNCDTRYLLSSGLLGPEGRRVRCSHCGHEWFQDGPEDKNFAAAMESVEPIPDSVKPLPEGSALPVLPGANVAGNPGGNGMAGYALAGLIFVAVLLAGYAFSSSIVRVWPATLAVYEFLNITPVLPGEGLTVDRLKAEVVSGERGLNMLQVSGYVTNLTAVPLKLTPLRVSLIGAGGKVIDSWLVETGKDGLGKEEEVAFSTSYPAPPTDAHEVNVRLEPFAAVHKAAQTATDPAPVPDQGHDGH